MRDEVLRNLARRAATDREFLRRMRVDTAGTLAGYGYDLTGEELAAVEGVRHRTAGMNEADVVRALVGGLEGGSRVSIARPAAPGRRGVGPARPARPGAPGGR